MKTIFLILIFFQKPLTFLFFTVKIKYKAKKLEFTNFLFFLVDESKIEEYNSIRF